MNLDQLHSIESFTLYQDTALFRVQRNQKTHQGDYFRFLNIAPPGNLTNRFDLAKEHTCYFALSPITSCYETLCRRESKWLSCSELKGRELVAMRVKSPLKLLNLVSVSSCWPGLSSLRFIQTQSLAEEARRANFDGIAYKSIQQPDGICVALFGDSIKKLGNVSRKKLYFASRREFHIALANAIQGSGVPVVP